MCERDYRNMDETMVQYIFHDVYRTRSVNQAVIIMED